MTKEARIVLDWASQYHNCAVNDIPRDVYVEVRQRNPMYRDDPAIPPFYSIRFVDGCYVAGATGAYQMGDGGFGLPRLDAVSTYFEILDQAITEPENFDLDLTEVL